MHPTADPHAFQGNDRYEVVRCLGSGSFGTVFEVQDHLRGTRVALKCPHESRSLSLLLFKHEFRALADVSHPNLVPLLEMGTIGEHAFFTMELVDGMDLFTYLRQDAPTSTFRPRSSYYLIHALASGLATPGLEPGFPSSQGWESSSQGAPASHYSSPVDFDRIRRVMLQVAEGLQALHEAGIIHRDLKPTNVLVTPQEHAVILDFGLSVSREEGDPAGAGEHGAVGTPAYAAPEDLEHAAGASASDWYSLGVMLYQVLTGSLPHTGNYLELLKAKRDLDPCPPSLLVQGIPEDLEALAMDLLVRDPAERLAGPEVLARLRKERGGAPRPSPMGMAHPDVEAYAERREAVDRLHAAHEQSRLGHPTLVLVHGTSGMGKSALLRHFLKEIRVGSPRGVQLRARCFEQEHMPFKALDGLVDGLSQVLRRLQPAELQAVLPSDTPALSRLFPVLNLVGAIHSWPTPFTVPPDPHEFRRRAFGALREILGRLAARRPVVVVIEDLHWGDEDSSAALVDLIRQPEAPPMLVMLSYDSEERERIPFLRSLGPLGIHPVEVELGVLTPVDAERAAFHALRADQPDREHLAAWVARESGGHPFFLAELIHGLRHGIDLPQAGREGGLDLHLQRKVALLEAAARPVLDLLAVAGRPVPWEDLRAAAGMAGRGDAMLRSLRARRLIRLRSTSLDQPVEPYHQRIRAAVLALMDEASLRQGHLRLGECLEGRGTADSATLAVHFAAGGDRVRAGVHAARAGDVAAEAMAFLQAAAFYRQSLQFRAEDDPERANLEVRLADALAHAGHGSEAGEAYLRAAALEAGPGTTRLRRRAAEEFYRSGHLGKANAILAPMLARMGAPMPAQSGQALMGVLAARLRLALRGLRVRLRPKDTVDPSVFEAIDTQWAVAMGLGPVDALRSSLYQARQLIAALDAGEPFRLVRGLAHECIFQAMGGNRNLRKTQQVLDATEALAQQLGHPNPLGRALIAKGITAILQGRWRQATAPLEEAAVLLRERCRGIDFEIHTAFFQSLLARSILGDLHILARTLPALLTDAEERGDLLAACQYRVGCGHFLLLAEDRPEEARRALLEAMEAWNTQRFDVLHYHALIAHTFIDFYEGAFSQALGRVRAAWRLLRLAGLFPVQAIRLTLLELRGRATLAHAAGLPPLARRLALLRAGQDIRRLRREHTPYGEALALKLLSGKALLEGEHGTARDMLGQAAAAFHACDMALHEEACQLGLARMERHAAWERQAREALAQRGIQDPMRWAQVHLPWMEGLTRPA